MNNTPDQLNAELQFLKDHNRDHVHKFKNEMQLLKDRWKKYRGWFFGFSDKQNWREFRDKQVLYENRMEVLTNQLGLPFERKSLRYIKN